MGFFDRTQKTETKVNQNLIEKIKEKKYYMYCLKQCYSNYMDYLTEEEKICLAKCNDTVHIYLNQNYEDLMLLKSKI